MDKQQTIQKLADKADSALTYCAGGGLAGFSCYAAQLQPILAVLGGIAGLTVCALKGYYDWVKHKRQTKWGVPDNDR